MSYRVDGKIPGEQLALRFGHTERSLRKYFERTTGRAILLTVTNNSTSLLSVREKGSHIVVRLHRMFLGAGNEVLGELGAYMCTRKGETPLFWKFVHSNSQMLERARPIQLKTEGTVHDLGPMFDKLNSEYFEGTLKCAFTWGASRGQRRVKRRTLGSYTASSDLIRMNPALDSLNVPKYYVEYVLYHEMLHASFASQNTDRSKRRRIHNREFLRLEREFHNYERAMAWEGKH